MVNLTVFSGAEIETQAEPQIIVTLFGVTEIYTPTVTQILLHQTQENPRTSPWSKKEQADQQKNIYITIFGVTSIYRPLLGREYMDLKNLLASGAIGLADFQVLWMQNTTQTYRSTYRTFTFFGVCGLEIPAKKVELKEIDRLLDTHVIQPDEHRFLKGLVSEDRSTALNDLPRLAGQFLPGGLPDREAFQPRP